jgi:hypothetical protein
MKSMKSLVVGMMILSFSFSAFAQQEEDQHRGPRGGGRGPHLTDTQRSCIEGILGKPGEGERPTHEQMDAAFSTCGIAKPNKKPASVSTDTSSSEAPVQ